MMGMPAEQQSPMCAEGYVSLFEILDAFGAPISEEHAWALAYQTCRLLQRLWTERGRCGCSRSNLLEEEQRDKKRVKSLEIRDEKTRDSSEERENCGCNSEAQCDSGSEHSVRGKEGKRARSGVYRMDHLRDLKICVDGTLHPSSADASAPPTMKAKPRKMAVSEQQLVQSVGVVLFRALDFRLGPDEQRSLSPAMDLLLGGMTSAGELDGHELNKQQLRMNHEDDDSEDGGRNSAAESEGTNYDEGIHDLEELDDETRSGGPDMENDGLTLDGVIRMCSAHMSLGNQADGHYKAVCRAFVAEWLELSTFLREVSKGTKELRNKSYDVCTVADDESSSNLDQLGFHDWAGLWVQVIRELRQGVLLKKVRMDQLHAHHGPPIEYELTPYEMLLDDIRSRRYKLNKVMVNGELPPRVKKDAFALILEFIRSRPPLVPVGQRRLKQLPPREPPLHERLMDAIRQQHRLRHVTTRYSSVLDYGINFGSDTCGGLSLSSTATNDSDESSPSIQTKSQNFGQRRLIHVDLMFSDDELEDSESSNSSMGAKHPSIEFVNEHQSLPASLIQRRASRLSWQRPTIVQRNDPSSAAVSKNRKLWRRHSIDACYPRQHENERLARNDPFRRSVQVRTELAFNDNTKENSKMSIVNKQQLECLSLTLEEVAHIRSVMTKAELETLLVHPQLYEDVSKSKVCFTCRKNRFNVLFNRPIKCSLCERSVCEKCSTKMHIPTHRFDRIPVYMLSPSTPPEDVVPEVPSRDKSKNRKSKAKEDIENAVHTYTSGSAPSSPNLSSRPSSTGTQEGRDLSPERFHNNREEMERMEKEAGKKPKKSWDSISKGLLKRPSILRVRAKLRGSKVSSQCAEEAKSELAEKLKAPVLPVCRDCKYLVRSIILSNRNPIVKSHSESN